MNIVVAPNAFKNSLDADEAAKAIAFGLAQSNLDCACRLFPVGDGGDGTGSLIIKHFNGELIDAEVHDALGRKISTSFGLIDNGGTAVIEMADASGIRLLKVNELNPLIANTAGTGEMIRMALDKGVRKIIIGMGGSATVDGGTGILSALGVRFLNAEGKLLIVPGELNELSTIDLSALDKRVPSCEFIVLCDVDNKLLGSDGAASVFGPQKGADAQAVAQLEAILKKFAAVTLQQTGVDMAAVKHGGTAGGAAAGLHGFLKAKLVGGANYFLELTNFDKVLEEADIIITGEGSIDEQTLQGKAPFAVANRAKQKQIPVIGLAGMVPLQYHKELSDYFDVLLPIGNEPFDRSVALKHTHDNLVRTAKQVGNILSLTRPVKNL